MHSHSLIVHPQPPILPRTQALRKRPCSNGSIVGTFTSQNSNIGGSPSASPLACPAASVSADAATATATAIPNTSSSYPHENSPSSPPPPQPPPPSNDNTKVSHRYQEFLDQWDKGFFDADECPDGYFARVTHGSIPSTLRGTFFRNGPGKFTLDGSRIEHPYDGDGFIVSASFDDESHPDKVFIRSRFVKTREYVAEATEDEVLFRGTFATQRKGGPLANIFDVYVKNTSNTNVVAFGDRVWSFFEAGQPYALNPSTLETIGPDPDCFNGAFKPGLPFELGSPFSNAMMYNMAPSTLKKWLPKQALCAGGDAVTAHPHIDPSTGRMVLFSYQVRPDISSLLEKDGSLMVTDISFVEVDGTSSSAQHQHLATAQHTLRGFAFIHDFVLTENYYIVFQNPVTVDNIPYILGMAPAASCVRYVQDTPAYLHLIPRQNGSDATARCRAFPVPPSFVFHHINAYEADANHIVIDSIHYDSLPAVGREALDAQRVDFDVAFHPRLRRLTLNTDTGDASVLSLFDSYLEMPSMSPTHFGKKYRFVYGYHSIFEDPQVALAKIDVETGTTAMWKPGKNRFVLEPKFVPKHGSDDTVRGEEDEGWIVAQLFDSKQMRSEIVVVDAQHVEQGPVAVVALETPIPSALHGCWSDRTYI